MSAKRKINKVARIVLIINSFLMALYGLVVIFQPNLFSENLEIYAGVNLDELSKTYKKLTEYIDMVFILNGAFNLMVGIIGIIAVYKSFRVKKKWLLAIIFITNIIGYLTPMIFDQITGVIRYPELIEIVSFTLSLIAFIIITPEFKRYNVK